jgi:ankyrin repeat protein
MNQEEKTRMKAVQLLLSRGADVNLRDDVGRTAFSYACELRCNDIVQILIKNNVDPDIPDSEGLWHCWFLVSACFFSSSAQSMQISSL